MDGRSVLPLVVLVVGAIALVATIPAAQQAGRAPVEIAFRGAVYLVCGVAGVALVSLKASRTTLTALVKARSDGAAPPQAVRSALAAGLLGCALVGVALVAYLGLVW